MDTSNITASGYAQAGIQNGFNRLADNSQVLANPNSNGKQVTENLLGMGKTANEIEALVKTLKTEDQMIGKLLDISA